MSRTTDEVSTDIVNALHALDPEFSAAIGTPERKIIDAVASVISASYIQSQINASIWDIDTKTGVELDELCGLFGFGRRAGSYANGVLAFKLSSLATSDYVIPAGTSASTIATDTKASISYQTTSPVIVAMGTDYVEVPAQCTEIGVVGNTAAQTIVQLDSWTSIASVYNSAPFTNGIDAETDEQLRSRFKQTFLRNLAGTEDFYSSLCLNHNNVSKVRILGPVERNSEQLQVVLLGDGTLQAQSSIDFSKFAWPHGVTVSRDTGTSEERYFTESIEFNVDTSNPRIKILPVKVDNDEANAFIHQNDVLEVEHEYVSTASRNDPASGITNAVDIYVNGSEATTVNEYTIANTKDIATGDYATKVFVDEDGYVMSSGKLQILGYGPVISLPQSFTSNNKTYTCMTPTNNGDYRLVKEQSVFTGSTRGVYGMLFTGSNVPANGDKLEFSYTYNRVPLLLDELLKFNKQITTDVLVHEADIVPIGVNMIVQLNKGYTLAEVQEQVTTALTDWCNTLPFGTWLQFSDMHAIARQVPGIDNARVKKQGDGSGAYGINLYSSSGNRILETRNADVRLKDSQLAAINTVTLVQRAENTFGS